MTYQVLDEADTMFDDRFLPEIKRIIEIMQKKQQHCQFILVAATVTKVHYERKHLAEKCEECAVDDAKHVS